MTPRFLYRRRDFIAGLGAIASAAVWSRASRAQHNEPVPRVAVLNSFSESDPEAQSWHMAFMEGLAALGWIEGRNIRVDVRWAGGEISQIQRMAKELLDLRPDVVLAITTPSVIAFRRETRTVPIVFTQVTDPVAQGLVQSLVRPGGNTTGFTIFEPSIGSKWVQSLKDIAPETTRAAVIFNPDTAPYYGLYMNSIETGAAAFGIEVFGAPVHSRGDIEAAITNLAAKQNGGLISMSDTFPGVHRDLIISLTANHRIPTVYPFRYFVEAGGLISYGIDLSDMNRRSASYVDQIIKGAKAGDLPVQLPVKFELVINRKAALALGRDIPMLLLGRADEVIE